MSYEITFLFSYRYWCKIIIRWGGDGSAHMGWASYPGWAGCVSCYGWPLAVHP